MAIKVKRTKAGNVRVTLSEAQLVDLWAILAHSHLHQVHPEKAVCDAVEATSRDLCFRFYNVGLRMRYVRPVVV